MRFFKTFFNYYFFKNISGAKKREVRTEKGTQEKNLKELFGGRWEGENGPKSSPSEGKTI